MSDRPNLRVQVLSDPLCPWCHIATRHMEKGFQKFDALVEFSVVYSPYLLSWSDDCCDVGGDYKDMMCTRYGAEEAGKMMDVVVTAGEAVGIPRDFWNHHRPVRVNTIPAHCLIQFAKKYRKQREVLDELFRVYFSEGKDIGNAEVLQSVAYDVGLDPVEALKVFSDPKCHSHILGMDQQAKVRGTNGVPTFIMMNQDTNNKLRFSGCQPAETFSMAVEKLL
eukprot:TRINITY_DN10932_c0_g1_i1.p1 TRINITY_DN10932_c0_g1~~TRINITY_DN10932_c0_g1_i1.p1  ORF type:complete len:222 (-),score=33.83 TRINITY_DN10932_c0_g1_i1:17-682(-)